MSMKPQNSRRVCPELRGLAAALALQALAALATPAFAQTNAPSALVHPVSADVQAHGQAYAHAPPDMHLERAVIVMRHGVRAATDTPKMNAASAQPWPDFEVKDGQLTPHGYQAVVLLGRWERDYFQRLGLLAEGGCEAAGDTFVWSSPASRTQATAKALLEGMFPGCQVPVGHATVKTDTLFHGGELGLGTPDPAKARAAILQAMGGDPDLARRKYAPDVAAMADAVGAPADCVTKRGANACGLYAKPWGVKDGGKVGLAGPVSVGASMSETIRMQYADGWPLEHIAFGHVKGADDVVRLMGLRSAKYDLVNHTPYLARRGGSQLLSQVAMAVEACKDTQGGPPPARLTVFVAHDTNISQLRAMLGFDWKLGNYRDNDAVPGGTLLFERFVRDRDGKRFVRVSYLAQSLDQMRNLTPLGEGQMPLRAVYRPERRGPDWMSVGQFRARVDAAVDPQAIAPESYTSVK
ncbi:MAG: histidine-type phosphatase [Pandoraea sp.]|nr:histidine-type phosphatase [Pandoraea sp.]MDR3398213.1 histidine-type phosphatase [Pandoraea sp.]